MRTSMVAVAMLAGFTVAAEPQQPAILTLACTGITTTPSRQDPVSSMALVVNFAARTVQGFPVFKSVTVTNTNGLSVEFFGTENYDNRLWVLSGNMNRVTGDVEAEIMVADAGKTIGHLTYQLQCGPTQRMF